ncbi:MAG: hypothetical protein J6V74_05005 [Bacteroidales bacterium]|nr:hypothetical protein [Bacteroidales bacterium]
MYYVFSVFVGSLLVLIPASLAKGGIPILPLFFVLWARLMARWFPFETKEANMSLKKYSIYQFGVTRPFYFVVFRLIFFNYDILKIDIYGLLFYYSLIGYFQWCVMTARFVRYSAENPLNKITVYLIPALAYIVNIFYGFLGGVTIFCQM